MSRWEYSSKKRVGLCLTRLTTYVMSPWARMHGLPHSPSIGPLAHVPVSLCHPFAWANDCVEKPHKSTISLSESSPQSTKRIAMAYASSLICQFTIAELTRQHAQGADLWHYRPWGTIDIHFFRSVDDIIIANSNKYEYLDAWCLDCPWNYINVPTTASSDNDLQ